MNSVPLQQATHSIAKPFSGDGSTSHKQTFVIIAVILFAAIAVAMVGFAGLVGLVILSAGETEPKFDGAYVQTTNGRFLEADTVYNEISLLDDGYYCSTSQASITIPVSQFDGFFLKGTYSFDYFSLHPLESTRATRNGFWGLVPEDEAPEGSLERGMIEGWGGELDDSFRVYYPGRFIDVRSYESDDGSGYYFEPRERLAPGKYVGWIEEEFWIIELTN